MLPSKKKSKGDQSLNTVKFVANAKLERMKAEQADSPVRSLDL